MATAQLFNPDPYDRSRDPVVLKGSDISYTDADVNDLVGFKYNAVDSSWTQVHIQIDEMHMQDYDVIKNGDCYAQGRNFTNLVYSDDGTYSGKDLADPNFDDDDEFVFMARDLGDQDDGNGINNLPSGVQYVTKRELEIGDPLQGGATLGWLYVFLCIPGSCPHEAGPALVNYNFNLLNAHGGASNSYKDAYKNHCEINMTSTECNESEIMNPEDSWFHSPYYERHFAENWYSDQLKIKMGSSTQENFISIQEFQFVEGNCGRCTRTFMHGNTGFIINKSGPVRAIRSWVGANSGTFTQREHFMYDQRDDQVTYLRVHPIPGAWDYMVYKEGVPLTYYNKYHQAQGISIDGQDDGNVMNDTMSHWEFVTGATGTYLRAINLEHNFAGRPEDDADVYFRHWFYDNDTPDCDTCGNNGVPVYPNNWHLCAYRTTAQIAAWGTHGVQWEGAPLFGLNNTDPMRWSGNYDESAILAQYPDACTIGPEPDYYNFKYTNTQYMMEPDLNPVHGDGFYEAATYPLFKKN